MKCKFSPDPATNCWPVLTNKPTNPATAPTPKSTGTLLHEEQWWMMDNWIDYSVVVQWQRTQTCSLKSSTTSLQWPASLSYFILNVHIWLSFLLAK